MVISGESNNQDLSSQALFLLGGLTVTEYPLKDQIRQMNEAQSIIWAIIFKVSGWQYDDSNQTNLPSASQELVALQSAYALPSETLAIRGIETKDSSGKWTKLTPVSINDITSGGLPGQTEEGLDEFNKTSGSPKYYRPVGDSIIIYPPPDTDASGGFKVYFDRGSVSIDYNATSTSPGFASEFHNALAVYAALQYCKSRPNGLGEKIPVFQNDWILYLNSIERFYSSRWPDKKTRITPFKQNNR
jgi:hypothetical protein